MKLSKERLEEYILGAIRACEELALSDKQERAALKALLNGTLEIEGYSRNEWTKFDPNDPKTFPQGDEKEVLLYVTCHNRENIEKFIIQATVNWISHNECYFSDFNGDEVHDNVDDITHWSPLPKPPMKEKTK